MKTRTLHIASAAFMAALLPGVSWAQDCTPDARRVVDAIYRQVLERNANGEGSTAVSQLNSGSTTVRELVRNIAKSNEHRQRFTPGAPASAVTYAYRHLLGREPDAGGLQAHTQVLESEDINAVIDNMIDSAEYQQLTATTPCRAPSYATAARAEQLELHEPTQRDALPGHGRQPQRVDRAQ